MTEIQKAMYWLLNGNTGMSSECLMATMLNGGPVEGMNLLSVLSNFLFSGLGNYVGGGLFIGLLYSWLNNQSKLYVD